MMAATRRKYDLRRGDYKEIAKKLGCTNKRAWARLNRENDPDALAEAARIIETRATVVKEAMRRLANASGR